MYVLLRIARMMAQKPQSAFGSQSTILQMSQA